MEQGQDLGRAAADVFVRLGGRVLARLPGYAGMRHGLKRPRLVLAPDREPQLGAEHAAIGGNVLVVAGARTEKVAQLIVSPAEPGGRSGAFEAPHRPVSAF